MALYHFSAQIISRSNGQSACAAAAYRSGEKITNGYDGITHDYRKKQNVENSVVMLPENAPADFADRQKLWNAVEQNEKQSNAQLAREFEFALPRELPSEVRERIAKEFVREQLVNEGMIVDLNFHNPPKMNSKKQPIDENGHATKDPEKYIYENPHCHALCTLRPVNQSGKWEAKRHKIYICEKDGKEGKFTAEELKQNPGWEKLYNYTDASGKKSWHTKSYAESHPKEGLSLVNRYPKSETIINPIIEKWNSKDMLLTLREAWATKVNEAFESIGMAERIDHRSYKDQGIDLIPTVHEGKSVTIAEKRLKEAYDQKIAEGEQAVLQHTEIRELNNLIRNHNQEIRIINDLKNLRERMQQIVAPVKERLEAFSEKIAECLERLRVEIIKIGMKIREAVSTKGTADEKIRQYQDYISDLAPSREERLEELQLQRNALKQRLDAAKGVFNGKKRDELKERIALLNNELTIQQENSRYAAEAQTAINRLKEVSESSGQQITIMMKQQEERLMQYKDMLSTIPSERAEAVQQERIEIRKSIEQETVGKQDMPEFHSEAENFDKKMKSSFKVLAHIPEPKSHKMRIKQSF